ncbi:hypothetical protein [Streptomyces atratus]|uniref:hypothetical protein n=1 Tax=Streptomyces atratus TaxID=1893 RepID=UPI00225B196A|nr:hypothetical protein [Streptomyces atratus]MCX5346082.1 hypothetical protein [Streptomyces atratus]
MAAWDQDAVVAAFPSQGGDGGECGGEVPGQPGQVGQATAGLGCKAPAGVGDLSHPGPGGGALVEVLVRLRPVVQGELDEVGGQQAGVQHLAQPLHRPLPVLVLATGDRGEEFGQGVRGRVRGTGGVGGEGERLPDGVVGIGVGGGREPAQVGEAVVAGETKALA